MEKRRLGKTEIEITPIGIGCWQFAQRANWTARAWAMIDQETITAIVGAALDAGIGWFDTAEAYGAGRSEQTLAAALAARGVKPGQVVVATKWWPLLRAAGSIGATIERRLSCLAPYPIDLHQVHQPFSLSPIDVQMKEMGKLLRAGRIRSVGVSNFSRRQMEAAHAALAAEGIPLASNQVRFNLLDRSIERNGVLETAQRLGVTIIAWSPLAQGLLTGRFHEDPAAVGKVSPMRRMMSRLGPAAIARTAPLIEELRAVARGRGVTAAQVALHWTVSAHGETVVAIPGASKPSQVRESAGAMGFRLSAREIARIDELSREAEAAVR